MRDTPRKARPATARYFWLPPADHRPELGRKIIEAVDDQPIELPEAPSAWPAARTCEACLADAFETASWAPLFGADHLVFLTRPSSQGAVKKQKNGFRRGSTCPGMARVDQCSPSRCFPFWLKLLLTVHGTTMREWRSSPVAARSNGMCLPAAAADVSGVMEQAEDRSGLQLRRSSSSTN
jgi:hypothetical protein